jgi:hypothetical protein
VVVNQSNGNSQHNNNQSNDNNQHNNNQSNDNNQHNNNQNSVRQNAANNQKDPIKGDYFANALPNAVAPKISLAATIASMKVVVNGTANVFTVAKIGNALTQSRSWEHVNFVSTNELVSEEQNHSYPDLVSRQRFTITDRYQTAVR